MVKENSVKQLIKDKDVVDIEQLDDSTIFMMIRGLDISSVKDAEPCEGCPGKSTEAKMTSGKNDKVRRVRVKSIAEPFPYMILLDVRDRDLWIRCQFGTWSRIKKMLAV